MREDTGNLFDYPTDAYVVPVNWRVNRRGAAIMGAGVARQAKQRWPDLPERLGRLITFLSLNSGPCVGVFVVGEDQRVVTFPTKHDWRDPASLALIERCLPELVRLTETSGWQTVALPRLGCGLGQLDWDVNVRPLLAACLDDRFVVVHR